MGISITVKVALALLVALLVLMAAAAAEALCPSSHFWDAPLQRCRPCAVCRAPTHLVLRPCHVLQDALCGGVGEAAPWRRPPHAPTRSDSSRGAGGVVGRRRPWQWRRRPPPSAAQVLAVEDGGRLDNVRSAIPATLQRRLVPSSSSPTSSPTQALDWQAAAVVAGVGACVLLFSGAVLRGLRQMHSDARTSAGADDLSVALSFMLPQLKSHGEDSCCAGSSDGKQRFYMEQLLVPENEHLKKNRGNVYIDRGSSKMDV